MSFDFTVAVVPSTTSVTKELQYLKSALLYADKVRLISPVAYVFLQLTDESCLASEQSVLKMVNLVMPFIKAVDVQVYNKVMPLFAQLRQAYDIRGNRGLSYKDRLRLNKMLGPVNDALFEFGKTTRATTYSMIGLDECEELRTLVERKQVLIEPFDETFFEEELGVNEYFRKLNVAVKTSYPLFDEDSNGLMQAAVNEHIISLSPIEKRRITHAGLADNYLQRLPSFDMATVDEIIDIRKELSAPVVRFRQAMIGYSDTIQSLPWDRDFLSECSLLYDREIAPTILEIEEATADNKILLNLGKKLFMDENAWKTAGGLFISVAASGVLAALSDVAVSNRAAIATGIASSSAFLAPKIAQAFSEHSQRKKDIERKDLYFYYRAGKLLERK